MLGGKWGGGKLAEVQTLSRVGGKGHGLAAGMKVVAAPKNRNASHSTRSWPGSCDQTDAVCFWQWREQVEVESPELLMSREGPPSQISPSDEPPGLSLPMLPEHEQGLGSVKLRFRLCLPPPAPSASLASQTLSHSFL